MIKLKSINDFELFVLGYKEEVIGELSHDNGISSQYYRTIDEDKRLVLALDIDEVGVVTHLDYLFIQKDYRGRGYLKACIKQFEEFAKVMKFKMVTLFSAEGHIAKYEKLGYIRVSYEETFGKYLMIKKLM